MALVLEDRTDYGSTDQAEHPHSEKGPTDMAAATASLSVARRMRPRGFDLLVMRVSLALLLWARRRADRHAISREEHLRRHAVEAEMQRRDHAALLHYHRVR